jgi:hypothetical protein
MSKRIINYNPAGKIKVGKPRANWTDVVNNDMTDAGIINWRIEAKDRDVWWTVLEETKAQLSP